MDFITLLGSVWPDNNFWATIIKLFDVNSYAWTILLFTVVLKLVLSPLDFLQRFYTNKTSRMQAKIMPEMEKLKKRYGQNQNLLYQKQNELYKKHNVNMKGSCIVMILYMVVTLTVFLTLFSSLQSISSFQINNQFNELNQTYSASYNQEYYVDYLGITEEEFLNKTPEEQSAFLATFNADELQTVKNQAISNAQDKVVLKYEEVKDSWLWVNNIWRADKPTNTAILNHNDFVVSTGSSVTKENYELVMAKLLNNSEINKANGYYILSIIVVLVSFLSQWLTRKLTQPKAANGQTIAQPGMTKILMFIMPIAMFMFTISSSAMFAIYIIANTLITTLLTPVITIIANKIENKKELETKQKNKAEYSR